MLWRTPLTSRVSGLASCQVGFLDSWTSVSRKRDMESNLTDFGPILDVWLGYTPTWRLTTRLGVLDHPHCHTADRLPLSGLPLATPSGVPGLVDYKNIGSIPVGVSEHFSSTYRIEFHDVSGASRWLTEFLKPRKAL